MFIFIVVVGECHSQKSCHVACTCGRTRNDMPQQKGPLRARWSKVSNNNNECKCRLKAAILQHNACMHVAPSNSKDKQTPRRKGPTNTKENTPNTKEKNTKEKQQTPRKKCKHQGKKGTPNTKEKANTKEWKIRVGKVT